MDLGSVILLIIITMCFTVFLIYAIKTSIKMSVDKCFDIFMKTKNINIDNIEVPKQPIKSIEKFTEHFDELTQGTVPPEATKLENAVSHVKESDGRPVCGNASLDQMHKRGDENIKPNQTACQTKQFTDIEYPSYYQTLKTPYILEHTTDIMGANYDAFGEYPDPLKLDFMLFNKNAPTNNPVGVNYFI